MSFLLGLRPYITFKNILIASGVIAVILVGLKINSVFVDNGKLKVDIAVKDIQISNLNASVQYRNSIITEVKARIAKMEALDKEREVKVTNEKSKSKEYINSMHRELEIIKKETPELLDEYYAKQYNDILDCIQDVTEGKQSKC